MIPTTYYTLNDDIDLLYKTLIHNGFYKSFLENICTLSSCLQLESAHFEFFSNSKCTSEMVHCPDRTSNIAFFKKSEIGIIFISTPCLRYELMQQCWRIASNNAQTQSCPLCSSINSYYLSPCIPMTLINYLVLDGMVIMPDGFPFMEKSFLITFPYHKTQKIMQEDVEILYKILKIADVICNNKNIMFFNGTCGNNVEHFHVHFCNLYLMNDVRTPINVPIFEYIDSHYNTLETIFSKYNDITIKIVKPTDKNIFFTGLLFAGTSIKLLSETVFAYIIITTELGYGYNFILRKNNSIIQIILFIRNITNPIPENLNLDALATAGIINFSTNTDIKITSSDQDYIDYINATNNIYDICTVRDATRFNNYS